MGKSRARFLGAASLVIMACPQAGITQTAEREGAGKVLPRAPEAFAGKIGATYADSVPAFPAPVKAPANAPNILLVLTDDVGFAGASTFGGPVPTPNLDRLAAQGLKYNRFHTTAMCSPTRAALLTGRNHHAIGNGAITDFAMGFPGYNGVIPKTAATIAETLRLNGYNTAMFGKHHNVQPGAASGAGPFDQWPTGLGFEYFYGFIGAQTNQFTPALYRGTTPVEAPKGAMLDRALADESIGWLHNQRAANPDKPFFIYYAPGSAHAPHQAPREWIARFRGAFDGGWDKLRENSLAQQKKLGVAPGNTVLTPRPAFIAAWSSLTPERRQINARMMEVYAGMLAYQDAQFGRLISELERMGDLENTLVIFIEGDNGGSGEGGVQGSVDPLGSHFNGAKESDTEIVARLDELGSARSNQNYSAGWAWALGSPFQWTKTYASHLGGVRNGMVVSWPAGIEARGIRSQFHHVIDIVPTILEATRIAAPTSVNGAPQQRMDGISMAYSFGAPQAPGQRKTQYFELIGNRGIYHDGWWAGTTPQNIAYERKGVPLAEWPWELYDLNTDFSQARNLAAAQPAKLAEMKALFEREAAGNQVLPIDDQVEKRAVAMMQTVRSRDHYTYWGKGISVPADRASRLTGSFNLTAEIETRGAEADGVLAALGGHFAGWSFYLKDGFPIVTMAGSTQSARIFRVASTVKAPQGRSRIAYDFQADGAPGAGGMMRISIDGRMVAQGRIEKPIVMTAELTDSFDIGFDANTPVTDEYGDGGHFNGEILKVDVRTGSVPG